MIVKNKQKTEPTKQTTKMRGSNLCYLSLISNNVLYKPTETTELKFGPNKLNQTKLITIIITTTTVILIIIKIITMIVIIIIIIVIIIIAIPTKIFSSSPEINSRALPQQLL